MAIKRLNIKINGVDRFVEFDPANDTLSTVLRRYGLTGVKVGCGKGVCGSCSVILNGKVIRSCTKKMNSVEEFSEVTTIEGIGTPNHLHPIQEAWIACGGAQCGFCTPGFIVSAYQLLKEKPDVTREEARDWYTRHRNICRCTGYKQLIDATMAAAKVLRGEATAESLYTDVEKADGSIYNTHYPRPTGVAKVTGLLDFGDDVGLKMPPGTLQVALVQPRIYSHAKILGIDYSEAEKMPGVVKVITAKDIKGTNNIGAPIRHPYTLTDGIDMPILNYDKIYNYGDVVAMVAADTMDHAREAARAVKVDLEPLPEYNNLLDAVKPDACQIHEGVPNTYLFQPLYKGSRDPREILKESEYVVECSTYTTREPHLPIEGDVAQAYYDEDGLLTVQCKSQYLYSTFAVAIAVGISPDKYRCVLNPVGGSFGFSVSPRSFALAALACVATGQPINLSYTYEEFIHHSGKRCPSFINTRLGCDKDGKITALEYDVGLDKGAYHDDSPSIAERFARFLGYPYSIKNARGLCRVVYTNHGFGTAYRGYGAPQCMMAMETTADVMAEKTGLDPWEWRFRNIARPGDTMLSGAPFKDYSYEGLMLKARDLYYSLKERAHKESTPEKMRGVGICLGAYNCSSGGMDEAGCRMKLNPDNSVSVYNTWEDLGQGGDIGTLVHVVEALRPLGLKPEQVHLCINDTKTCPNSGLAGSSRSHFMNGNATLMTAGKLMDAMRKEDGTYRTYDEMVAEGIDTDYTCVFNLASLGLRSTSPTDGSGDTSPAYMYAVYVSEVEVDAKTGKAACTAMHCYCDVGVVGNYLAVDGQAYGGMSHSIGFALTEIYEDYHKHNHVLACGVPTANDIPDGENFTVDYTENARGIGPHGSSGCSEVFQSSAHAAVLNAIKDACGVRIYELPATPAKIKAGLDALANGEEPYKPARYDLGPDMYQILEELKASLPEDGVIEIDEPSTPNR